MPGKQCVKFIQRHRVHSKSDVLGYLAFDIRQGMWVKFGLETSVLN